MNNLGFTVYWKAKTKVFFSDKERYTAFKLIYILFNTFYLILMHQHHTLKGGHNIKMLTKDKLYLFFSVPLLSVTMNTINPKWCPIPDPLLQTNAL